MGQKLTSTFIDPTVTRFLACFADGLDTFDSSLMNGLTGVATISAHLAQAKCLPDAVRKQAHQLSHRAAAEVTGRLSRGELRMTTLHTICSGLSGVIYGLDELTRLGVLSAGLAPASRLGINDIIAEAALADFKERNVDFLHGPLGVFLVLLENVQQPETRKHLDSIMEAYLGQAVRDARGCRIYNSILQGQHGPEEYNTGLAHGLTGHILIWCRALELGYRPELMRTLITEQLAYLESYRLKEEGGDAGAGVVGSKFYPKAVYENDPDWWLGEEGTQTYNSRVGYCYGDLNVAFAQLRAGRCLGNAALYEYGLCLARHVADRLDPDEAQIHGNALFCHGSAGLVYMFGRLAVATGEACFQRAADVWQAHFRFSYWHQHFQTLPPRHHASLLDGHLGATLSQLSRFQPGVFALDQALLLNL